MTATVDPSTARVSVVTGAAAGIGRAVAHRLAARGDRVVCVDRDGPAVAAVSAEVGGLGLRLDVAAEGAGDTAVAAAVDRFGRVDVAVACAGIERNGPAAELPVATVAQTLAVNVTAVFDLAASFARQIGTQGGGGRLVLVGSVNSFRALPGQAGYATSKGAVLMLARALAVDWAGLGLTVNVVAPGVTDTAMSARSLGDPDSRAALLSRVPLGRPAHPDEIAGAVAFLTGPDAAYITGACLPVDGGWLAAG